MKGLIRRRQGAVEILFYNVSNAGPRAASFDSPPLGWWVLTLRRDG